MKLLLRTLLVLAPVALSGQTIVGTPHDLRPLYTGAGATNQVCIFCHTPHNAAVSTNGPLWNHTPSAVALYTVYTSGSMTQTAGQPGAQSKACLSCHDGTVAVGSVYNNGTPTIMGTFTAPAPATEWSGQGQMTATNPALVGTDLSNDHPIAIIYPIAGNSGFKTGAVAIGAGIRLYGGTNQVECASCHAVHDNTTAQPFLRINNNNSALCTACHIK